MEEEFSPMQSASSANTNGDTAAAASNGHGSAGGLQVSPVGEESGGRRSASPRVEGPPREEPEVIKRWKEEQARHLMEKDRLEEEARIALKEKAKKELEDWYNQHSEQLSKLQTANRAASESAEKEIQSTTTQIRPGTEWERVAKLCDFNPKTARNVKDVSRMRAVILQLKQAGGNATKA